MTATAPNGMEMQSDGGSLDWRAAIETLTLLLRKAHDGCVSSLAVRQELERKGTLNPRQLVIRLKHLDFEDPTQATLAPLTWKHHGRSFYTEEAFARELSKTASQAESAAAQAGAATPEVVDEVDDEAEPDEPKARRGSRQEEARLVRYVVEALSDIYTTDVVEDLEVAFDVHSDRAGNDFENVDAIAVHWRSRELAELVSIEVKLAFTAKAVQQANNYRRFSDRVWIAVPVQAPVGQAAVELRDTNARLFEYAISQGIGILACRRAIGKSYEVFPVHWPARCTLDGFERDAFIDRHRPTFELAGVVPPRSKVFPRLR